MKSAWSRSLAATALCLTSFTSAQVASLCDGDACFKLNIPQNTAASGTGDIFFQISAPSTYEWVALGQGTGMKGANIFVVYTSKSGTNVTLSPRLGTGHVQPNQNGNAQVTLLAGSGVSGGKMIANVRCSSCNSWSGGSANFSGSNGDWIHAYHASGGPKNSDDAGASISHHNSQQNFQWNYADAKGGNSVNPLLNTSSSGTTLSGHSEMQKHRKMLIAHGTLAALAFVIFFPAGAIAVRLASFPGIVWFHAAFQAFAYVVYIAAFGLGVYLANEFDVLDKYHPIIGIVVFIVLFFQPIFGWLHHALFKKHENRTVWSHIHIWLGRIAITLGIINGGLGMLLADTMHLSSRAGKIAYGVIAGIVWLAWVGASVLGERKTTGARRPPKYTAAASSPLETTQTNTTHS